MAEEYFVNVQTTKFTDNEVTPMENAIIAGAVRNTGISDGIIAASLNGLGARAHRMQRFGSDPEKWSAGLPAVQVGFVEFYEFAYDVRGLQAHPGEFYPMATIREDKTFLTEDSDPAKHKETKRLMKRVAVNLDSLIKNIEDDDRKNEDGSPVTEPNPVNDLEDIFFGFALDLYSTQEKSAEYMFDFWEATAPLMLVTSEIWSENEGGIKNAIQFEGAGQHLMYYFVGYIGYSERSGTLVDPNKLDSNGNPKEVTGLATITRGELTASETKLFLKNDSSTVAYSKQISPGVIGTYELTDVSHDTFVDAYGTGETLRVIRRIAGDDEEATFDTFHGLVPGDPDFGRSGFYIPLCFTVLEEFSQRNEEKVLSDGMMLIMHAAVEVELKWYQTWWFKLVMIIIIAVVVYLSFGALITEGMLLADVLTELVIQFGLAYIVELLIKNIGGELGMILAIAVAGYAVSRGDFTKANAIMPHAKEVLIATHAVSTGVRKKIEFETDELIADIERFDQSVKERKEEIHAIASLLAPPPPELDFSNTRYQSGNSFQRDGRADTWFQLVKGMKNAAGPVKQNVEFFHSRMKELNRVPIDDRVNTA